MESFSREEMGLLDLGFWDLICYLPNARISGQGEFPILILVLLDGRYSYHLSQRRGN